MNHKRHRPKHQRAGCLACKPHKDERGKNGASRPPIAQRRRDREDVMTLGGAVPE